MTAKKSSVWRIAILFAFVSIVGCLSIARPTTLSENKFLIGFMGPDLVSVLVVVVTITFASVANIHLSVSRMVASAPDKKAVQHFASVVRQEINSNAWCIFWALGVAIFALFIHGACAENSLIQAMMIAVCLTVVLLNGLVIHDIYRTIFLLATQVPTASAEPRASEFSSDSTPTE